MLDLHSLFEVKKVSATKIAIDKITYTENSFKKNILSLLASKKESKEVQDFTFKFMADPAGLNLEASKIYNTVLDNLNDEKVERSEESEFIIQDNEPFKDMATGRQFLKYRDSNQISPIHFDNYKDIFTRKEWEIEKREMKMRVAIYHVGEDIPETVPMLYKGEERDFKTVNTYTPATWTTVENKGEDLHPDHRKAIELRFNSQECLERYYCALYHTLANRNKNICMTIHERQGTGKTLTYGDIPGALVGRENYSSTDNSFLTSPHKDILLRNRVLFLDEYKVTKKFINSEKLLVEDWIYVNPKGQKARTIRNTSSVFGASNHIEDVYMDTPMDRRKYILDDSGKSILEECGSEWISNYKNRLASDKEFVANLAYWILNNFKDFKYSANATYRGPTFESAVRATCFSYYEEAIFSLLIDREDEVEGGYLSYLELKDKYNRKREKGNSYFPRRTTFMDFFKAFTWGGEPICRVEEDGEDILLKVIE